MIGLSDLAILSNFGGVEHNDLINILHIDPNEPQVIQHSSYYDMDEFNNLITNKNNYFSILSLNIQSINAKFHELETLIESLLNVQFYFSIICLQECCRISDHTDVCTFQLSGYDCLSQGKSSSDRGGLITYVHNSFQHEVHLTINNYEHWEGQVIHVKGGGLPKEIIIGNIYRPPRMLKEQIKQFIKEFTTLIVSLEKSNLNINLAGDYNLNLLKINVNESFSEFFYLLVAHSLFPKITLPTRLAHDSATLIDHLFCKLNKPTHLTTAGILLNKLSDYQPCFILLDTDFVHHKHSKYIKIYKQNDEVIENIKYEISNSEQLNKIDINQTADLNVSYGIIHEVIEKAKNKHMLIVN